MHQHSNCGHLQTDGSVVTQGQESEQDYSAPDTPTHILRNPLCILCKWSFLCCCIHRIEAASLREYQYRPWPVGLCDPVETPSRLEGHRTQHKYYRNEPVPLPIYHPKDGCEVAFWDECLSMS